MFLLYMFLWSVVITFVVGVWHLGSWRQLAVMVGSSWCIVFISYVLATELSANIGLDLLHFNPLLYPEIYFRQGVSGWLVLLIIPCGWLSPAIGINLAQRWETQRHI